MPGKSRKNSANFYSFKFSHIKLLRSLPQSLSLFSLPSEWFIDMQESKRRLHLDTMILIFADCFFPSDSLTFVADKKGKLRGEEKENKNLRVMAWLVYPRNILDSLNFIQKLFDCFSIFPNENFFLSL